MQLGRYQILKQLATGGVADVLLARATGGVEGFARHVVLKRIRPEYANEERFVASFLEEARIAAALHHQNIVTVNDIGEHEGTVFFAMEYVHGEDVRKLLLRVRERGQLVPLDHVVSIISATAAGLHHAHEQHGPTGEPLGVVHRDVSPTNILIGYDGSVKLVDFGLARAALRSTKTVTGTLRGQASYMSPEQCCGRTVDRRTDTFSLGIVLYELVTARRLFKGANEFTTMAAIVEGKVPTPSQFRDDVPPALDAIILKSLAKEPSQRFQTAEDMRAALEEFAREHQLRASNKALADYLLGLFGQRPEPWLTDEVSLITDANDFDTPQDPGIVVPPSGTDEEVVRRQAPTTESPLAFAQAMTEPSDDDEASTVAGPPVRPTPRPTARPARGPDDEDESATLVAPPLFDDVVADAAPPQFADPIEPQRPRTNIYVGPPAPSRLTRARDFIDAHPRQVAIGISVGTILLLVIMLSIRGCDDPKAVRGSALPGRAHPAFASH
ncbi:MAG: protein kinase [Kofleriaceae bacterium]|nr:protein kinase [Kofleriaceae bacterium]